MLPSGRTPSGHVAFAPVHLAPLDSKCGNPHARWLLIEQATHYRFPPKISEQLSRRQTGQARWILELSWSTQLRLNTRFRSLAKRRLHHNKIKVSVARELCAFIWELGTRIESKTPAKPARRKNR